MGKRRETSTQLSRRTTHVFCHRTLRISHIFCMCLQSFNNFNWKCTAARNLCERARSRQTSEIKEQIKCSRFSSSAAQQGGAGRDRAWRTSAVDFPLKKKNNHSSFLRMQPLASLQSAHNLIFFISGKNASRYKKCHFTFVADSGFGVLQIVMAHKDECDAYGGSSIFALRAIRPTSQKFMPCICHAR